MTASTTARAKGALVPNVAPNASGFITAKLNGSRQLQFLPLGQQTTIALQKRIQAAVLGNGKWDDLTPIADCQWHWARTTP